MKQPIAEGEQSGSGSKGSANKGSNPGSASGLGAGLLGALGMKKTSPAGISSPSGAAAGLMQKM